MISCPKPDWLIEAGLRAGLSAEDIDSMSAEEVKEWIKGEQAQMAQSHSDEEEEL